MPISDKQSQANKEIRSYEYIVESYALFNCVDIGILKVNRLLEKYGYQFISISMEDLERDFFDLFSIPEQYESKASVNLHEGKVQLSNEFYEIINSSGLMQRQLLFKEPIILLSRIQTHRQIVVNNTVDNGPMIKVAGELQRFASSLIQQFRLFRAGDISCSMQFQIAPHVKKVVSKMQGTGGLGRTLYILEEEDVKTFCEGFKEHFLVNDLAELALNNFNLSYNISDSKTRFVTLMTCLESLFNRGNEQIAHIIARHLALIISNSEVDFDSNYKQIKKLYRLRSAIVHGDSIKENLGKEMLKLEQLVRIAINHCLMLTCTREELFNKLNQSGISSHSPQIL